MRPIWYYTVRLLWNHPWLFGLNVVVWTIYLVLPLAVGLLNRAYFDALLGEAPAAQSVWTIVALLVAYGIARIVMHGMAEMVFVVFEFVIAGELRANML